MLEQVNYKNWPYRLLISSYSFCQLCCNRILVSRLHKTPRQRLWWFRCGWSVSWGFSCEIPVCLENVTNLCLSCWVQEFVSYTRAWGKGRCPKSFFCASKHARRNVSCACWPAVEDGGKSDKCMSAKMDYSAGQWGQYLLEGASSWEAQTWKQATAMQTDTDRRTALESVPVTIATTWNRKSEIISVVGRSSTLSVPAELFKAALMFYTSHDTLVHWIVL